MRYRSFLTIAFALAFAAPAVTADQMLSQYRGVTLGDTLSAVISQLRLADSDIKMLHDRPVLVQEVTWRAPLVSGAAGEPDSLSDMVLTFQAGRLRRIAVHYPRERIQGMTDADLREAMSSVYGPSLLVATPTRPTGVAADRQTLAQWEKAETLVVLWREQFPIRAGLTITSTTTDAALLKAIADGAELQASEAPARDRSRKAAEAAAIQARDEKIRLDNKTKFKPR